MIARAIVFVLPLLKPTVIPVLMRAAVSFPVAGTGFRLTGSPPIQFAYQIPLESLIVLKIIGFRTLHAIVIGLTRVGAKREQTILDFAV